MYPRNKGPMLSCENCSCVHFFEFDNFSALGMDKESLDSNQYVAARPPNLNKLYDIQILIYRAEISLTEASTASTSHMIYLYFYKMAAT
jgi:hypothetical protein